MLGGQTQDVPLSMLRSPAEFVPSGKFPPAEAKPPIVDPIPERLKPMFFANQLPPDILKDYDCIGFDADHCIIKYKTAEMLDTLIVGSLNALLADYKGYPEDILKFDWKNKNMWMNATLWDIDKGMLLKLGK
jgi:hypothetical protein